MIVEGSPDSAGGPLKVYWTETALEQVRTLMGELERSNPVHAQRLAQRLTMRSAKIAEAPRSSIMNPEFQAEEVREVSEGPYRMVFLHQPERIDILLVLTTSGGPSV